LRGAQFFARSFLRRRETASRQGRTSPAVTKGNSPVSKPPGLKTERYITKNETKNKANKTKIKNKIKTKNKTSTAAKS